MTGAATFDGDKRSCFGLALRAAMLSDLYLTGQLEGKENRPYGVFNEDAGFANRGTAVDV